jgi:hypothetical protein
MMRKFMKYSKNTLGITKDGKGNNIEAYIEDTFSSQIID